MRYHRLLVMILLAILLGAGVYWLCNAPFLGYTSSTGPNAAGPEVLAEESLTRALLVTDAGGPRPTALAHHYWFAVPAAGADDGLRVRVAR